MIKRVVWGLVAVGLVGVLVAGAVIRTAAKTGNGAPTRGRGQGEGAGAGRAQVREWLTIEGGVVRADGKGLVVRTDDGQEIVVENRPWAFAQEQGFAAQRGDRVRLTGFYEGGTFETGEITEVSRGQTVRLRDQNGRPMWAGQGRRNG